MLSSGVGDPAQELAFVTEFTRQTDAGLVQQTAGTIAGLSSFVPTDLTHTDSTNNDLTHNYARWIRSLYGARAHELGWNPAPGETQKVSLLRIAIVPLVATYGEDSALASEATQLARAWLKDHQPSSASSLDPDMVQPVLAAAAWNGDRAFYDLLVDEITKDKVQRERAWMIGALTSFRDPEITRARLELLFGKGIDARELQRTLMSGRPQTQEIAWSFVQQNFDKLNSTIAGARGIPFGATLPMTATSFCDSEHQKQVEDFFQPRLAALSGAQRYLQNTVESIQLCGTRRAVLEPALVDLLNKQ